MIAVLLLCMVKHAKRCHHQQAGRYFVFPDEFRLRHILVSE
jgi:hypothetical protein